MNERKKYLHILPANSVKTFWFLKALSITNEYDNSDILIMANKQTILEKQTCLLEFTKIKYLVGGEEGEGLKRRRKRLKEIIKQANTIIWHDCCFNKTKSIDLYKNKKILNRSIIVFDETSLIDFDLNIEENYKKFLILAKEAQLIGYGNEFVKTALEKYKIINEKKLVFTPYLLPRDYLQKAVDYLQLILDEENEKIKNKINESSITSSSNNNTKEENFNENNGSNTTLLDEDDLKTKKEQHKDDIFDFPDDIISDDKIVVQLDYLISTDTHLKEMTFISNNLDNNKYKVLVPFYIWINGISKPATNTLKNYSYYVVGKHEENFELRNESYGIVRYIDYLKDVDIIVIYSDIVYNKIYIDISILVGKTFVIDDSNPYYEYIKKSGCQTVSFKDFFDDNYLKEDFYSSIQKWPIYENYIAPDFSTICVCNAWNELFGGYYGKN